MSENWSSAISWLYSLCLSSVSLWSISLYFLFFGTCFPPAAYCIIFMSLIASSCLSSLIKILGCVCCYVFLQLTMPALQMIGCSWRYWDVCVVRCFFSWLCQPSKWLVVLEDIGMCVLLGVSKVEYVSLPNDWLFLKILGCVCC